MLPDLEIDVPRGTNDILARLKLLVLAESRHQNLISEGSIAAFDDRHIADSLQLLPFLPSGVIVDIGSGGGFPGLVLGCMRADPCHLVEPRAKRAAFLDSAALALGLSEHVHVHACRVERLLLPSVAAITARAVASLDRLFAMAAHIADENTRWVLPKGRSAASELEEARKTWQGSFRLVASQTDAEAAIVIAEGVRRRRSR
jgi:16S rRNA (guanine527-N7)-methyltransferase